MGKDYYKILDVPKTATEDQLKKAYKKMALKWHPDRHQGPDKDQAEKKFKEVSEAFEVLNDKQKRAVYDQYGEEALKSGMPPPGSGMGGDGGGSFFGFPGGAGGQGGQGGHTFTFSSGPGGSGMGGFHGFTPSNPEDIFQQIFMGGGMGDFMGGGPKTRTSRSKPTFNARDSTPDMFGGFNRREDLSGSKKKEITRTLPVNLKDLYTGASKKLKVTRKIMDPNGSINQSEKILQIDIKPGWKSGTKVRFSGEGDDLGHGPQDIVILIEEKTDPVFKRVQNDLHMNADLSLEEALCGFKKTIKTIDGRSLTVENVTNVVDPGQESRISNEGMPISKTPGKKGDLIITYNVKFPRSLTPNQKAKIKEALQNP
ncbi:hypothetical protein BB559_000710 [Furculomyces boomerangus]|uniref:J domain-containing protein n=1 Tax=Furculomyces boomerangus TaxID=61424 RepID=A0A2T9Z4J5_9FUNG|nr:hypothetical protein BB559_004538 [Furculomyces boomerangus]PVU99471.1 hypothetical protein BB559_000710 [Furculomyces boomerangus]